MLTFILAFLAGDLTLQTFSSLPSLTLIFGITIIVIIICFYFKRYLPLAFMLGFAYTAWYAHNILSWELPKELEGKPHLVTGCVASIPVTDYKQVHFLFALENTSALIRLSAQNFPQLFHVGDKWQLQVRLKRIHGSQNAGAFDYEAWAMQKGLRASGSIISSVENKFLSHHWYHFPIAQIRERLLVKMQKHLPDSVGSPWLIALVIGERIGIKPDDWQVLRNTGTNHLMAIAGLHIGMIAGFAHTLVSIVWRCIPTLVLLFPAQLAGGCAALFTAFLYSALAGFSIPTQRACIMLTVFIIALLLRRNISAWTAWSLAMILVLLLNPLSVLTESFFLSFATIALIIYGMSARLAPTGWWWKWGRVQWVIGLGLIPITLALFQECSLVSFLANSVAIPWLGIFILPFCFLSGIFLFLYEPFGAILLFIASKSLAGLWCVLSWFSHFHFAAWQQAIPNTGIFLLTVLAFILLLIPAGMPGRWLGMLWLLPLVLYQYPTPEKGNFWLTLLDVGQGLSVVVQTKSHVLVYDAGPKYSENFDMGASVVVPYLRTNGTKTLDMLVVSHGDNDHIGGAPFIIHSLPVTMIKTSVPEKITNHTAELCLAGTAWEWDGVKFDFIYPTVNELHLGNDSSCVLRVSNGTHAILLTGDVEKFAEKQMLQKVPQYLPASILIAPHHGSKTSGVEQFVNAVHPSYVLYATGYRNRYHFPHVSVVRSYTEMNSQQFSTAECGEIQFRLDRNKMIAPPLLYRTEKQRYWM